MNYLSKTKAGFAANFVETVFVFNDIRQGEAGGWRRVPLKRFNRFNLEEVNELTTLKDNL